MGIKNNIIILIILTIFLLSGCINYNDTHGHYISGIYIGGDVDHYKIDMSNLLVLNDSLNLTNGTFNLTFILDKPYIKAVFNIEADVEGKSLFADIGQIKLFGEDFERNYWYSFSLIFNINSTDENLIKIKLFNNTNKVDGKFMIQKDDQLDVEFEFPFSNEHYSIYRRSKYVMYIKIDDLWLHLSESGGYAD